MTTYVGLVVQGPATDIQVAAVSDEHGEAYQAAFAEQKRRNNEAEDLTVGWTTFVRIAPEVKS